MARDIRFRASAIGRLMTEPTAAAAKAGEVLSVGAKSYIRELVAQDIFGVDFDVSGKPLEKGIECEDDSIALYNQVFGRNLKKNGERRKDEYFTGESDLPDEHEVVDIKTPWSVATFPLCDADLASTQRTLYEYQLRVYMRLWDKPRAKLAFCLVDTPERLIGYEPLPLHVVSHIPPHLRVTVCMEVTRDPAIEAAMVAKVIAARRYYSEVLAEFDRTHRPLTSAPIPTATPAPAVALPEDIFS
jgi:hypothetical protein